MLQNIALICLFPLILQMGGFRPVMNCQAGHSALGFHCGLGRWITGVDADSGFRRYVRN